MPRFVATYAYTDDTTTRDAVRPSHREYLASLDAVLLAGPTDAGGAVMVFEAASAEEVEGLLDADPFATHGGIVAMRTVVGWQVVLGSAQDRL